jgi:hypothetical protein
VKAAADGATVTITAEPAMSVLGTLGIVDDPSATSDYPIYNNGLTNATPYQYLSTYLVPWFTAQGITWIAIGNVDFTTRLNFAWSEGTALHVIQEITTLSENEFSFRRNGDSGYYIDIEPARNISENPRLVSVGRNMVWLSRQRRIAPLKTVILAKGAVPQGAVEVSTFAENAWLVTAVSSNDITLADPATGQPGPFRFNNQCVNNYILKKDGTYTQISATSATTQIATVASATGIAVGDHVSVRRTNTGKYLTLLTNPAAVTKYGTFVGVASRDTYRGERNYIAGGALPAWTQNAHTNSMIAAQVVGTESTPGDVTIALKSAPVGAQINAGDVLLNIDTLAVPNPKIRLIVGGPYTVDGSGNVTVTVNQDYDGPNEQMLANEWCAVIRQATLPAGWTAQHSNNSWVQVVPRIRPTHTGLTVALKTVTGTSSPERLADISGLPASGWVYAGMVLSRSGSISVRVLANAQANGSGVATVLITPSGFTAGGSATLTPTTFPADAGATVMIGHTPAGGTTAPTVTSPAIKIPANATYLPVWGGGMFFSHTMSGTENLSAGTQANKPQIEILNGDTDAVLTAVQNTTAYNITTTGFKDILRGVQQPVTPTNYKVRARLVGGTSATNDYFSFFCWAMLHTGIDPNVPVVEGSHGNKLWHYANDKLEALSSEQRIFRAKIANLAELVPELRTEKILPGQNIRLKSKDMAGGEVLDVTVRVVAIKYFKNPLETELTLDTLEPRIAKLIGRTQIQQLWANVPVTVDASGNVVDAPYLADLAAGGGSIPSLSTFFMPTPTSAGTPVLVSGATRGVIEDANVVDDDGLTPIPIKKYYKTSA